MLAFCIVSVSILYRFSEVMHLISLILVFVYLMPVSQPKPIGGKWLEWSIVHHKLMAEAVDDGDYRMFGHSCQMNKLTNYELLHLLNQMEMDFITKGSYYKDPERTLTTFHTLNHTLNRVANGAWKDLELYTYGRPAIFFTDYAQPDQLLGFPVDRSFDLTIYFLSAVLNHVDKWLANFDHLAGQVDHLFHKRTLLQLIVAAQSGLLTEQQFMAAIHSDYVFFVRH